MNSTTSRSDLSSTNTPKSISLGVLVVGHGTRNQLGVSQFLTLVEQIKSFLPNFLIEGAFLELAQPDLMLGLKRLKEHGCNSVLIVPVLLFTAAHAKEDIPDQVALIARELGMCVIGQSPSLGTHPSVIELSQNRFEELALIGKGTVCLSNGCAWGESVSVRCGSNRCRLSEVTLASDESRRLGCAMVGRGTSDLAAIEKMKELTDLRVVKSKKLLADREERHSLVWTATGFFAGPDLTVDSLLGRAAESDANWIIVQPHLLFEGELMDQLREKVRNMRARAPEKRWWIARPLGADSHLAQVFAQIVRETLENLDAPV